MSPLAAPARQYQAGVETTNGTAVAATAKLIVPDIDFQPTDNVNRPRQARGQAIASPGGEFPVVRGSTWSVPAHPLNYEQLPFWLRAAIQGGVTATGGGAPYTWTFARSGLVDPALKAATLERRRTDFTNHVDHEFAMCMPTRIRISGAQDGDMQLEVEGIANRREGSTFTASLQGPTLVQVPFARTRVYLNDDWASLGNTLLAGKVISWSFEFMTGVKLLRTADNNSDLDHDIDVIDGREVDTRATIRVLMDKTLYDAELAKAETDPPPLRAVRFKADGPSSRAITIDGLYKHTAGSLLVPVDEVAGQDVYDITLQGATDGTNFLSAVVVNTSAVALGWAA